MSLALVWCQAREKTEPLIGRRESKEKSNGKMNWCQEGERIEALLSRLENKEKSAEKDRTVVYQAGKHVAGAKRQLLNTCVQRNKAREK